MNLWMDENKSSIYFNGKKCEPCVILWKGALGKEPHHFYMEFLKEEKKCGMKK
jgi:hypothetical protein